MKHYYTESLGHDDIKFYPPQRGPTLLIKPKCTEAYYTKPVEPIEKYAHTQCRQTPQLSPSVQNPTTPKRPSPLIKPKCTETYYTKPV